MTSTRHKREIQGLDAQGHTAPQHKERNDFRAKAITPKKAGKQPSYTLPDANRDGEPD